MASPRIEKIPEWSGGRVEVYHSWDNDSLVARDPIRKIPLFHCARCDLTDAKFVVDAHLKSRWSEEHRNVHAWVEGELRPLRGPQVNSVQIEYKPGEMDTFQTVDGRPVSEASRCYISYSGLYADLL